MRAYFINNMYLSSIQQGIQAAHAITELSVKYGTSGDTVESRMYVEWAEQCKVMCVLNGGYQSNLIKLMRTLESTSLSLPWAPFYESEEALNGALTSIAIILPETMYGSIGQSYAESGMMDKDTEELYQFISSLRLAS